MWWYVVVVGWSSSTRHEWQGGSKEGVGGSCKLFAFMTQMTCRLQAAGIVLRFDEGCGECSDVMNG